MADRTELPTLSGGAGIRESAALAERALYREVRVRIRNDLHVKLHAIRVLRGHAIGDVVTAALEAYFRPKATSPRPAVFADP